MTPFGSTPEMFGVEDYTPAPSFLDWPVEAQDRLIRALEVEDYDAGTEYEGEPIKGIWIALIMTVSTGAIWLLVYGVCKWFLS